MAVQHALRSLSSSYLKITAGYSAVTRQKYRLYSGRRRLGGAGASYPTCARIEYVLYSLDTLVGLIECDRRCKRNTQVCQSGRRKSCDPKSVTTFILQRIEEETLQVEPQPTQE